MKIIQLEQQRHAEERGAILRSLQEDYGREMTTVRSLSGALDLQGYPLSVESLQFSLQYLADQGYLKAIRAGEIPAYRRDRMGAGNPETILFVKLLPKGIQLLDGMAAEDPRVRF